MKTKLAVGWITTWPSFLGSILALTARGLTQLSRQLLILVLTAQFVLLPLQEVRAKSSKGDNPFDVAGAALGPEYKRIYDDLLGKIDGIEAGRVIAPDSMALNGQVVRWKWDPTGDAKKWPVGAVPDVWQGDAHDLREIDISMPSVAVPLEFPKFVKVLTTEEGFMALEFQWEGKIFQQIFGSSTNGAAHQIRPLTWAMDNEFLIVLEENGQLRQFDLSSARTALLRTIPSFVIAHTKFDRATWTRYQSEGKELGLSFVGRGGGRGMDVNFRPSLTRTFERLEESIFPGEESLETKIQTFGDLELYYRDSHGERVQVSRFNRGVMEQLNTFYLLLVSNLSRLLDADLNAQVQRHKEFVKNFFVSKTGESQLSSDEGLDFGADTAETLSRLSPSAKKALEESMVAGKKFLEIDRVRRSMTISEEEDLSAAIEPIYRKLNKLVSQGSPRRDEIETALAKKDLHALTAFLDQETQVAPQKSIRKYLRQMISSKALRVVGALSLGGAAVAAGLPVETATAVSALLAFLQGVAPVLFEPIYYMPSLVSFAVTCLHIPVLYLIGAISKGPEGYVLTAGQKGILIMTKVWVAMFLPWWHRIAKFFDRELVTQALRHQVFDIRKAVVHGSSENKEVLSIYNKLAQRKINRKLLARALAMRMAAERSGVEEGLLVEYMQKASSENWTEAELERRIERPGFAHRVDILTEEFYAELQKAKQSLEFLQTEDIDPSEMAQIRQRASELSEKIHRSPALLTWARFRFLKLKRRLADSASFMAGLGYTPHSFMKNALINQSGLNEAFRRYKIDYPLAVGTFMTVGPKANPAVAEDMAVQLGGSLAFTNPTHLGEMYMHFFLHTGYGGTENSLTFSEFHREMDPTYYPQSNRSLNGNKDQGQFGFVESVVGHFKGLLNNDQRPGKILLKSFMNSMHMMLLFVALDLSARLFIGGQAWAPALAGVMFMQAMRIAGYNGPWVIYNAGEAANRRRLLKSTTVVHNLRADLSQALKSDDDERLEEAYQKMRASYDRTSGSDLGEEFARLTDLNSEFNQQMAKMRGGDFSEVDRQSSMAEEVFSERAAHTSYLRHLRLALDSGKSADIAAAKEALVRSYSGTQDDRRIQEGLRRYQAIQLLEFSVANPPIKYKNNEAALNFLVFAFYGMVTTLAHSVIHVWTGGASIALMATPDLLAFVGQGMAWAFGVFGGIKLLDRVFYESSERKSYSAQMLKRFKRPLAAFAKGISCSRVGASAGKL